MKYLLVENQTYVLMGPIDWRPRMLQSEIDELSIPWAVPPVEQGYIKITDNYEIFPVVETIMPNCDSLLEELVGPSYIFNNNQATLTYTKKFIDIAIAKNNIKNKIAASRYIKENAGTTITINGNTYNLETDRDNRAKWYQLANLPGPTNWKFGYNYVTLTNTDANNILEAVKTYIQTQFDWEMNICNEIDALNSISDLQTFTVTNANVIRNV